MFLVNLYADHFSLPPSSEVRLADGVTIKGSVFCLDYRVVAIDSHRSVVVRDRESKNVPVEFFLALYEPEKLNDGSDCESHAMNILSVCGIKCCSTALYFAR
jgi:hypothetical protein